MNCIEAIVEGQQVVVDSGYRGAAQYSVGTVTKVSKTRITISVNGQNHQYNRRDGVEIGYGDSWSRRPKIAQKWNANAPDSLLSIEEVNQIEQKTALENNKKRLAHAVKDASISKFLALSLEELQAIADKIGVEK